MEVEDTTLLVQQNYTHALSVSRNRELYFPELRVITEIIWWLGVYWVTSPARLISNNMWKSWWKISFSRLPVYRQRWICYIGCAIHEVGLETLHSSPGTVSGYCTISEGNTRIHKIVSSCYLLDSCVYI